MSHTCKPELRDLTIEVTVQDGKTMTRHRMDRHGTLTFDNRSDATLVVKSLSRFPPFLEEGETVAKPVVEVPANSHRSVHIAPEYQDGDWFVYSAQIGDSRPDDPIVIVDRR